jgi:fructose-1,6-bisphosphatase I
MKAEDGQVNEYVIEEKKGDEVEKVLASENLELPEPHVYGIGGNKKWTENLREFENQISQELKLRYGGAFVGDINQIIHHGGMFAYPHRTDAPQGKYRLLFEANPIAYIIQKAGGKSTNLEKPVLKVEAEELHQRTPFFTGNKQMIQKAKEKI